MLAWKHFAKPAPEMREFSPYFCCKPDVKKQGSEEIRSES